MKSPAILENYSLRNSNTFGVEAAARYFFSFSHPDQLADMLISRSALPPERLVLGGGSNLLFTRDFPGLVLHPCIRGIEILERTDGQVLVRAGAGEVWDDLVGWSVENQLCGLENLSAIPGHVGACPVQNIGAYGAEASGVVHSVLAFNMQTLQFESFRNEDCEFAYRDSLFKRFPGRYVVLYVVFSLNTSLHLNTSYAGIEAELTALGRRDLAAVRDAVMRIRSRKLPDPALTGNAGSFFKNPVIDNLLAEALKAAYPPIPLYPAGEQQMKVAAGWLIEQCGWKGCRTGDAGVHPQQALVLVNYGQSSGTQLFELSEQIRADVEARFGIALEREVIVI